jgi:hypothetical protein
VEVRISFIEIDLKGYSAWCQHCTGVRVLSLCYILAILELVLEQKTVISKSIVSSNSKIDLLELLDLRV